MISKADIEKAYVLMRKQVACTPFGFVDVSFTLETKGHPLIAKIKQAIQVAASYCQQEGRWRSKPLPLVPREGAAP